MTLFRPTFISKESSVALRGVALFMMIFLHLFNKPKLLVETNVSALNFGGDFVVNFLSRGMGPVELYLFLSGYGLFYLHKLGIGGGYFRILKLFILYWLTMLIFVPLGCWIDPSHYPGNWQNFISNLTGYHTTYNYEAWFLFPYILLAFSSKWIFKFLKRFGTLPILIISCVVYLISSYATSRYFDSFFKYNYSLYQVTLYFIALFPFLLGALFCKYSDREIGASWTRLLSLPSWILGGFLILLFLLRCVLDTASFSTIFVCVFVLLFTHIRLSGWLNCILKLFGRYSAEMWLIHTYFCCYLFKDFIYGFKYPLVILLVEILLSLVSAYVIHGIAVYLYKWFGLVKKTSKVVG